MTDADRQGSFAYVDYSLYGEMDDEDNYDEDSFEQEFGLDPITDPEEKERREEALWENEEIVKEENDDYLSGKNLVWTQSLIQRKKRGERKLFGRMRRLLRRKMRIISVAIRLGLTKSMNLLICQRMSLKKKRLVS